jgi:hypothetical protein
VALVQAVDVPLALTFRMPYDQTSWYKNMNLVFDLLFYIDFVLMFFTSVLLPNGRETFDSHEICLSYMQMTRFYLDSFSLLGTFPFSSIQALRTFRLLKFVRIFRLATIIRKSTFTIDVKAFMNIMRLVLYLYLYIHCVGCIFWFIIESAAPTPYLRDIDRGFYYPMHDFESD